MHNINGTKARVAQTGHAGICLKLGDPKRATLIIDNCKIYDSKYNGIEFDIWDEKLLPDVSNKGQNCVVKDCEIYNCGINGILFGNTVNSTIENCKVYNCGNDNTQPTVPPLAILIKNSSGITVQKCEVYNNKQPAIGIDFQSTPANNCIIQYNYIHDNSDGIFKINSSTSALASSGNIFRYNVCQNNGGALFSLAKASSTLIHNNTVYSTSTTSVSKGLSNTSGSTNNKLNNNIIFLNSSTSYDAGATWDYNCFFGTHSTSEPADAHKVISDPQFKSAGSGGVGRSTADGYILKPTSPCIDSGVVIANAGIRDFWGNLVPHNGKTNIGAYDGTDGNVSIVPAVYKSAATPYVFSRGKDGRITASISNSGRYTLSIIRLNGKMLLEKCGIAPEHITIPANSVPSGAHLVRLDIGGQSFTRAIMAIQ